MFPVVLGLVVLAFRQGLMAREPVRSIVRPMAISALAGVGVSRPRDVILRPMRLAGRVLGWALGLASNGSLSAVRDVAANAANDSISAPLISTASSQGWVTIVIRRDMFKFVKVAFSFSVICLMVFVVYKSTIRVIFVLKNDSKNRWMVMEEEKHLQELNRGRSSNLELRYLPTEKKFLK